MKNVFSAHNRVASTATKSIFNLVVLHHGALHITHYLDYYLHNANCIITCSARSIGMFERQDK